MLSPAQFASECGIETTIVKKIHNDFHNEMNGNTPEILALVDEFHAKLQKIDSIRQHHVIARLLCKTEGEHCDTLHLEWTADTFWGLHMPKTFADLQTIYAQLEKHNKTEDNLLNFNDADDDLFIIPNDKKCLIVYKNQNWRLLFIWEKEGNYRRLHVRQIFDVIPQNNDKWDQEELDEFKKDIQEHGYQPAINKNWSEYADDQLGNHYPKRPSIQYFAQANWEPRYGDGRDVGYVLTWDENSVKIENTLWGENFGKIKYLIECYVPSMLYAVDNLISN